MDTLKQNLENNLGIDTSDIGYNLPTGTITLDGLNFYIDDNENVIHVEDVQIWTENSDGTITNGDITLSIGTEINYDPSISADTSVYTSYASENGSIDQTFNNEDYTEGWIILDVNDGKLRLISKDVVKNTDGGLFNLAGATGLKNAITEFNNISSIYGQAKYALSGKSVTLEDLAPLVNFEMSDYTNGYGKDKLYQYGNTVTYSWPDSGNQPNFTSSIQSGQLSAHEFGFYWYDFENETLNKSDIQPNETITTLTSDFYGFNGAKIDSSSNAYNIVFNTTSSNYWIANRYTFTVSDFANFGVCFLDQEADQTSGSVLISSYGTERTITLNGVRPVVTLQSNVKLTQDENGGYNISV